MISTATNWLKPTPAIFALMMFLLPMTVGAQYPPPLVRNQYDTNAAPNLTGDITTTGGGLATTLKNTGTAGQYTKVTFDAQGRETSGTTLSSGDIPDLSGVYDPLGTASNSTNNTSLFRTNSGSFTSLTLATALSDETGTGAAVFGTSPTIGGVLTASKITATNYSGTGAVYIKPSGANSFGFTNGAVALIRNDGAVLFQVDTNGNIVATSYTGSLPDLSTTYEAHVATLTNGYYASNAVSGGTFPLAAIPAISETGVTSLVGDLAGKVPTNSFTLLNSSSGIAAMVVSNDNRAIGLGSTNYFSVRNTNSAALAPDLNVNTNGIVYAGNGFSGDGSRLTSLAAAQLTGSIADARLSANVSLLGQTISEGELALTDVTTANASTSAHGFVKKLPNDATQYYDGTGAYSVPAGSGIPQNAGFGTNTTIYGDSNKTNALVVNTAGVTISNANGYVNDANGNILASGNITSTNGVFSGNGSGVTNVWVKQMIFGSSPAQSPQSGNLYGGVSGSAGLNSASAVLRFATPAPTSGYLSNLECFVSATLPTTTNLVFCVQTNVGAVTPVDSLLIATLTGSTGIVFTNSGSASCVLNTNEGSIFVMRINSTATLASTYGVSWRVEWWHQSP